jgi:hypothetical protein
MQDINDELKIFYRSLTVVRAMKSRMMLWGAIKEIKNA